MDCSLPGSSVHGIFQARVLEWGAIAFFTGEAWCATIHGVAKSCRDEEVVVSWQEITTEGNGNPLQYCCLENPMDGGAW